MLLSPKMMCQAIHAGEYSDRHHRDTASDVVHRETRGLL
jgi:hypothetical protein